MRASLGGVLAATLLLALAAAPAAVPADDGLATVAKVRADGSVERVRARILDMEAPLLAPAGHGGHGNQAQPPPEEEPAPGAVLEAERLRPTRDITFYGHVFGLGLTPAPRSDGEFGPNGPQAANTIFPTGDANLGLGFFDWCTSAGNLAGLPPQPAPDTGCDADPRNKVGLFLTAGPVQVHAPEDFVYSKLHNERGRTKDIVLDANGEIKAWIWMSLDAHSWSVGNGADDTNCIVGLPPDVGCPYPYWGWDPSVWPDWVVEAKLYTVELGDYGQGASEPPPILEAWAGNAMTLVAEGRVGPQTLTNGLPGSPNVHEFEISLGKPLVEVLSKTDDVVLVYSFYTETAGQKFSIHNWRVWAGELFPTRFTLPVKNPVDVELVIPQFVHDKLLIHSVISSAFGSYDVDVPSATLEIQEVGGPAATMTTLTRVGDFQVAHGAHFKPVNVTWIWDYKADKLRPGTYTATVRACNMQGSACEATEARFTIGANLQPTSVVVGRSGQRTVSDQQLDEITSGAQATTQALAGPAVDTPAPLGAAAKPARAVPGPGAALLVLALLGGALLAARRWG